MNLIHSTLRNTSFQSIDIALYTQSMDPLAVFECVFIETYFNHVFRIKHSENMSISNPFRFKFVLSRVPFDLKPGKKSLHRVVKSIENLVSDYSNIVIVDDSGRNAWYDEIPDELCTAGVSVEAIVAERFKFVSSNHYIELTTTTYEKLYKKQMEFEFLKVLFDELYKPKRLDIQMSHVNDTMLHWRSWRYLSLWH